MKKILSIVGIAFIITIFLVPFKARADATVVSSIDRHPRAQKIWNEINSATSVDQINNVLEEIKTAAAQDASDANALAEQALGVYHRGIGSDGSQLSESQLGIVEKYANDASDDAKSMERNANEAISKAQDLEDNPLDLTAEKSAAFEASYFIDPQYHQDLESTNGALNATLNAAGLTQQDARNQSEQASKIGNCSFSNPRSCFIQIITSAGTQILKFCGLILWLAGIALNYAMKYGLVDMSSEVKGISAINVTWAICRDVANLLFIFLLLYAAIGVMLQIETINVKKAVFNIVMVAILINFSLFISKVVIDASNVIAIHFYNQIAPNANANLDGGLSDQFMQPLHLQTIYYSPSDKTSDRITLTWDNIITITLMGSIFVLVASFVFFVAAALFIFRYIMLILLMVAAPLAFLAYAMPGFEKWLGAWWHKLLSQAFFAPIFMFITYLVLKFLGSGGILNTAGSSASFESALSGNTGTGPSSIALIINFVIVIILLLTTLYVAKIFGAAGAKHAQKLVGGATLGLAAGTLRNTVGRYAQVQADDKKLQFRAAQGGFGGWYARNKLKMSQSAAKSSFDARSTSLGKSTLKDLGSAGGKGGFKAKTEADKKKHTEFAKTLSDDKIYLRAGTNNIVDKAIINQEVEADSRIQADPTNKYLKQTVFAEKAKETTRREMYGETVKNNRASAWARTFKLNKTKLGRAFFNEGEKDANGKLVKDEFGKVKRRGLVEKYVNVGREKAAADLIKEGEKNRKKSRLAAAEDQLSKIKNKFNRLDNKRSDGTATASDLAELRRVGDQRNELTDLIAEIKNDRTSTTAAATPPATP